jgi:hypothetical protein
LTGNQVENLRGAFSSAHKEPSVADSLKTLLIERFVVPDISVYDETKRRAERVERADPWP